MERKVIVGILIASWLVYQWAWDHFDPKTIDGKRVLITGASSGIGEQLAYKYSKLGARVFIAARRPSLLQTVAENCKKLGAKQVEFYPSDMGLAVDRKALVLEVKKRLGGLDHLILNHGILIKDWWMGSEQNMTALLKILNINFISYVDLASMAMPMLNESHGNIGIVSSVSGVISTAQTTNYCVCKFALHGFFIGFRQELIMKEVDVSVTLCIITFVNSPMTAYPDLPENERPKYLQFILDYLCETTKDTATAIMRSVANRQNQMYFGNFAYVMVYCHMFFPASIERLGSLFINLFPMVQ